MRAVVIGASGFIGSHLVDGLLASGWQVRALARHLPGLLAAEALTASRKRAAGRLVREVGKALAEAVAAYRDAVAAGEFPAEAESSSMDDSILAEVLGRSSLDQPDLSQAIPLDRDL